MIYKPLEVYKLAVDIYGEDRVSVDLLAWDDENDKGSYSIIILFPEIEITNSHKGKHLIKNLYFKIVVSGVNTANHRKANINLYGLRQLLTAKEAVSGYGHSHLSGLGGWGNFCIGVGDFVMTLMAVMDNMEETDWNLFFLSIENYLKWESLEGGPYRQMSNISYGTYATRSDITSEFNKIKKDIPISAFYFDNGIELIDNSNDLIEYYNKYSPIKSKDTLTNTVLEKICKDYAYDFKFEFNGKIVGIEIIPGEDIPDSGYVSQDVINEYNDRIKNNLKQFNTKIGYEQLKLGKEELLGKAATFK